MKLAQQIRQGISGAVVGWAALTGPAGAQEKPPTPPKSDVPGMVGLVEKRVATPEEVLQKLFKGVTKIEEREPGLPDEREKFEPGLSRLREALGLRDGAVIHIGISGKGIVTVIGVYREGIEIRLVRPFVLLTAQLHPGKDDSVSNVVVAPGLEKFKAWIGECATDEMLARFLSDGLDDSRVSDSWRGTLYAGIGEVCRLADYSSKGVELSDRERIENAFCINRSRNWQGTDTSLVTLQKHQVDIENCRKLWGAIPVFGDSTVCVVSTGGTKPNDGFEKGLSDPTQKSLAELYGERIHKNLMKKAVGAKGELLWISVNSYAEELLRRCAVAAVSGSESSLKTYSQMLPEALDKEPTEIGFKSQVDRDGKTVTLTVFRAQYPDVNLVKVEMRVEQGKVVWRGKPFVAADVDLLSPEQVQQRVYDVIAKRDWKQNRCTLFLIGHPGPNGLNINAGMGRQQELPLFKDDPKHIILKTSTIAEALRDRKNSGGKATGTQSMTMIVTHTQSGSSVDRVLDEFGRVEWEGPLCFKFSAEWINYDGRVLGSSAYPLDVLQLKGVDPSTVNHEDLRKYYLLHTRKKFNGIYWPVNPFSVTQITGQPFKGRANAVQFD